jgi:hypothetical protein
MSHTDPAQLPEEGSAGLTTSRRPPVALLSAIPGLLAIMAAVALPLTDTQEFLASGVAVALGVFGVLLTALTIVLALVIDVGSRWPSLTDLVRHGMLAVWFMLAFAAVVLAVIGQSIESPALVVISLGISLTGALFGIFAIYRILHASGGDGRRDFLAGLLASAFERERERVVSRSPSIQLDPFLSDLDAAVEGNKVEALHARLLELDDAAGRLRPDRLQFALDVVCRLVDRLGRAALIERVDPEVSRTLIPELIDTASRLTARLAQRGGEDEIRAAVYLGQLARTLAWIHGAADARTTREGVKAEAMRRLMLSAIQARRAISLSVHPDPPSTPSPRALPEGFTDPTAAVVWLWGFLDFNGTGRGQAMYAFFQAVTGERFRGAYEGGRSLVQEIEGSLNSGSTAAARDARRVLGRGEELRLSMLELAATALAVTRPLNRPTPEALGEQRDLSTDPYYAWMHAQVIADLAPRAHVRDALRDLAALLGSDKRVSRLVAGEYGELGRVVFPELIAPSRRPAACVLACALPYAFDREHDRERELRAFAQALPEPLLLGAVNRAELRFGRTWRRSPVERFVAVLTRRVDAPAR